MTFDGLWSMVRRGLWRILTRAASALEEAPDGAEEESSTRSAPADWLARVRKGAPQLLEQRGSLHTAQPPRPTRSRVTRDDDARAAAITETRATTDAQRASIPAKNDASVPAADFTPHSEAARVREAVSATTTRATGNADASERGREQPAKHESDRAMVAAAPRARLRRPVAFTERPGEQAVPADVHEMKTTVAGPAVRLHDRTHRTIREHLTDEVEATRDDRDLLDEDDVLRIGIIAADRESDFHHELDHSRPAFVHEAVRPPRSVPAAALSSHDRTFQVTVQWPSLEVPVGSGIRNGSDLQPPADLNDRWPELPALPPFIPSTAAVHESSADDGDRLRRLDEEQRGTAWSA